MLSLLSSCLPVDLMFLIFFLSFLPSIGCAAERTFGAWRCLAEEQPLPLPLPLPLLQVQAAAAHG